MTKGRRMRLQSVHSKAVRGLEAYFSPYEAIWPLADLEPNMPKRLWEPAAGDGVIVRALRQCGYDVVASDIANYFARGLNIQTGVNYLHAYLPNGVEGIVSNPPYTKAMDFIEKAIGEVPYHAWLLRTNFMESQERYSFFKSFPPARILVSSRRLPMMHRVGYDGNMTTSNTCFAWFIWDDKTPKVERGKVVWFDWLEHNRELETEY